ncbi:MAG: hypothetical protein RIB47_03475 [Cyclobacteriaceae bacterium]
MVTRISQILVALIFVACNSDNDKIAVDRSFYFTITSPRDQDLVNYLGAQMDNQRVAITNQSGTAWPFYETIETQEQLPIDSLMPPHHFVHLLKQKANNDISLGDYYVDVKVMTKSDTLPNYDLTIYRMDSTGLEVSARTGIHYLNPRDTLDTKHLRETLLKSIIRYSFK